MRYLVSIERKINNGEFGYMTLCSEYPIKARSEVHALLKTIDKQKLRLKPNYMTVSNENGRETMIHWDKSYCSYEAYVQKSPLDWYEK